MSGPEEMNVSFGTGSTAPPPAPEVSLEVKDRSNNVEPVDQLSAGQRLATSVSVVTEGAQKKNVRLRALKGIPEVARFDEEPRFDSDEEPAVIEGELANGAFPRTFKVPKVTGTKSKTRKVPTVISTETSEPDTTGGLARDVVQGLRIAADVISAAAAPIGRSLISITSSGARHKADSANPVSSGEAVEKSSEIIIKENGEGMSAGEIQLPTTGGEVEVTARQSNKQKIWEQRDRAFADAPVVDYHSKEIAEEIVKDTGRLLAQIVPPAIGNSVAGGVFEQNARFHAVAHYGSELRGALQPSTISSEKLRGHTMPNRARKLRNDRVADIAKDAPWIGVDNILVSRPDAFYKPNSEDKPSEFAKYMEVKDQVATQRACDSLGIEVYEQPADGIMVVKGEALAKAFEDTNQPNLLGRKNKVFGLQRDNGLSADGSPDLLKLESYEVTAFVQDPDRLSRGNHVPAHYLATFKPASVQSPGEEPNVRVAVTAVEITPLIQSPVFAAMLAPDNELSTEQIGTATHRVGSADVVFSLREVHRLLTAPERIGQFISKGDGWIHGDRLAIGSRHTPVVDVDVQDAEIV